MTGIRIAMIGAGKITVDQHIPTVLSSRSFRLVAAVSPHDRVEGVPHFHDVNGLLAEVEVDAVAINTPPQVRFSIACLAIEAGKHVLLEKPPCATVAELRELERRAAAAGVTIYTGWHSQHAPAVPLARDWLAGREVKSVTMLWCENVRQWHPGQDWIWEPGALGVFDPGINALSILSAILPSALILHSAVLQIPANRQMPVAAKLNGSVGRDGAFSATLDFLREGPQIWSLDIETSDGVLSMSGGGATLSIDGCPRDVGESAEYPAMYRRFSQLIATGRSEIDDAPLSTVADAFLIGRRTTVADFVE